MMRALIFGALRRAHAATLWLYPRDFRRAYAQDMDETFFDLCATETQLRSTHGLAASGSWYLIRAVGNGLGARFRGTGRSSFSISPRFDPPSRPGETLVTNLLQDLRFAFRTVTKNPGFSLIVVGLLAVGVGANTAIYSIFNSIYLNPVPYAEPHRLVQIDETAPELNLVSVGISPADFLAWQDGQQSLESIAVYDGSAMNLLAGDEATRVSTMAVTWQMAAVLGTPPLIGRDFTADDDTDEAQPVTLLTHSMWQERFGGDRDVIGSTLRLDELEFTVIGVLPPDAVMPYVETDLWVPLHQTDRCCDDPNRNASSFWLSGIGRIADGVTLDQVREDLKRVHAPLVETLGDSRETITPVAFPYLEATFGDTRPVAMLLFAAVGILLLVACANVGGLLLARATDRQREVGLRIAIGAGRGRIIRQLLTESALLAGIGGTVGMLLGYLGFRGLLRILPESDFGWVSASVDWRFAVFSVAVSALAALLFGLAPAFSASRVSPQQALRDGGQRTSAGPGKRRTLKSLVVAEIALAAVLLVGSGLLLRALQHLNDVEPGFATDRYTVGLALPALGYEDRDARTDFYDAVKTRIESLPGVESVGLTTRLPMEGHNGNFFDVDGGEPPEDNANPVILTRTATPDYFEAIGIQFLAGSAFDANDGRDGVAQTIVVNEAFAQHFWNRTDVVGERVRPSGTEDWLTIVGVNRDTKHYGLDEPMRPGVFLPYRDHLQALPSIAIAVAGPGATVEITPAIREIVRELDSGVPLVRPRIIADLVQSSFYERRVFTSLLGIFATVAVLLAVTGLYSTLSYTVGQRRHEIGVRMALGARSAEVQRAILRDGAAVAGLGLVIGLVLSAFATQAMSSVLFGIQPLDAVTYASVVAVLATAAVLANWLPARRASRTDPTSALRAE